MKWFYNLSTKAKLTTGFGLIIVMIIAMFLNTQNQLSTLWNNQKTQYDRDFQETVGILRINININAIKSSVRDMLIGNQAIPVESLQKDIEERSKVIIDYLDKVNNINSKWGTENKNKQIGDLKDLLLSFIKTIKEDIEPRILQGKNKDAEKFVYGIQLTRYKRIKVLIQELQDEADLNSSSLISQSQKAFNNITMVSILVCILVIGASIMVIILFLKILSSPLKKMAEVTRKIAQGNLSVSIDKSDNQDEIGVLTNNFASMITSLKNMLGDVSETISVLGSASVQISTSSSQLAASANETATSVTETTTTVEEVRQSTNNTNQKAKQVAESSQRATQVSAVGKKYTDETIEGINKIGNQMESIADSIVKLSEQSRAIADIISTVNDLAEQTNLLAVNASIEAARAGEQGKGFVVVAQEIKSLADQSKLATNQVRTILNDIQNAIAAAVMATEQGSKIVEASIKQSNQTGSSIQSIAETINETAQLGVQISMSSQEQSVGMDQVALAMENIKYASIQNAQTTKQLESSAINLKEMGNKLKELVQNYKM